MELNALWIYDESINSVPVTWYPCMNHEILS